jgi:hypothetical protein
MERRTARNWYWWLWLSPFLTVPTAGFLYGLRLGFYETSTLILAVLIAALWHLLLLIPATNKDSPFVRWHGRQELALAGIRTAIPVLFLIRFGFDYESLVAIPTLIVIWFGGTLWGQLQASRGKCTLASWAGRGDELAVFRPKKSHYEKRYNPDELVQIIRDSSDLEERQMALARLKKLGLVESL